MPYNYEWWVPVGDAPWYKGTGIRISNRAEGAPYQGLHVTQDIPNFVAEVRRCLRYIYMTVSGRTLLDFLNGCPKTISIEPATYGMGYNNQTGNPLKSAVGIIRNGTKRQIYALFNSGNYDISKFITNFNRIPEYRQDFTPVFDWTDFRHSILRTAIMNVAVHDDPAGLDRIIDGIQAVHGPRPDREHTANSLIMAIYESSTNGAGGNVLVQYNEYATDVQPPVRPSAIGLAHELVHAYYSVRGMQPSAPDRLLDDLICIGLGPWANAPISENQIRAGWNTTVFPVVPVLDVGNALRIGPRQNHAGI